MVDPATLAAALTSKATEAAAKDQQAKNAKINDALIEKAKNSPDFERAALLLGRRVATRAILLSTLWLPAIKLSGLVERYFERDFYADVAGKLSGVPEEDIQPPKPSVAVPAMQGLALSLDEPSLKDAYLTLLATASRTSILDSAHPSFAEILKQLSGREAELIQVLASAASHAIARLDSTVKDSDPPASSPVVTHVMNWQEDSDPLVIPYFSTYMDNWIRLGLVKVSYDEFLTDLSRYSWVESRPELPLARTMYASDTREVTVTNGILRFTSFGDQFCKAVGLGSRFE